MPNLRTRISQLTPTQRLVAAASATLLVTGCIYAITELTAGPPNCANPENQARLGMTAASECMDEVLAWCNENHPTVIEGECMNKAYGYDPTPFDD